MLTLEELRGWLKEHMDCGESILAGSLDADKERSVGVYNRRGTQGGRRCLGGAQDTLMQEKTVSILLHWTKSDTRAEQKAGELYTLLAGLNNERMGSSLVFFADAGEGFAPVGRDGRGVREYVVEATLYYKEEEA